MSAESRLRIHNLWAHNGLFKRKSPKLNTQEAFLCLAQSILATRAQPHIPGLVCEIYWEYRTAGHLVFWKPWPAVELEKVLSVTKHGFVLWAQRKPNTRLEIYKAFQDRLTFLNRHMIVKISWNLSIMWNLLRIKDCRPFSVLETLTGYRPYYSHSVIQ